MPGPLTREARLAALAGALVLALCTGCGTTTRPSASPQTAAASDAVLTRSGWQPLPVAPSVAPTERWRVPLGPLTGGEARDNGDLLLAGERTPGAPTARIRRMNPVTGTTVWSVDVPLTGDGGFIQDVSDPADQVIVAHTARQTTVLDAATGRLVWRGDGWWGTGGRLDNLLVMDQADGPRDTLGIDWTTGAQRWRQSAPAKTQTDAHAPDALGTDTHVDGDAVVMTQQLTPWSTSLGAYRGEWLLGVRDPATGTPRWHTTLPTASGTFLVIGTTLITASFDGSLAVGYDVATGARKWKTPVSPAQPLEGPSASYLAQIDTDTVLVSTSRLGSTALRASTGAPLWTDPATLPSDEPTVFRVGGKSYLLATFADHDGAPESVEVRDPSTGHPLHRTPLHVAYRRLASDTAYTIADDFLIALRLPELTERWRVPLRLPPGGMASIAAVVPNTVILDIETLSGVHQIQGAFVGYGVP